MIPRYSRPEMSKIWSDENRFSTWLKIELAATDGDRARDFYRALHGWTVTESSPSGFRYLEYAVAGTRYGGILPMTKEWGDMPSHWSVYIPVPDVDACCARVAELGGTVCVPAFDAPGVGRIARIDDPAGVGCYIIKLLERGG